MYVFSHPVVQKFHITIQNANEIISVMKETDVSLSISGHYHKGSKTVRDGSIIFINSPGICEKPFPYTIISKDKY